MNLSSIQELMRNMRWTDPSTVSRQLTVVSPHVVSVPGRPPVVSRRATSIEVVARDTRPIWQQRGWRKTWAEFVGYYRTKHGSWEGKATESPSKALSLFIRNPPERLSLHPHWACFRRRSGNWYFVHTYSPVHDLSSGILEVEKILIEAHQ